MEYHISGPNEVQLAGFHSSQSPGRQSWVRTSLPTFGHVVTLFACSKMNMEAEEAVEAEDDFVTIQVSSSTPSRYLSSTPSRYHLSTLIKVSLKYFIKVSLKYYIKVSTKFFLKCQIKYHWREDFELFSSPLFCTTTQPFLSCSTKIHSTL